MAQDDVTRALNVGRKEASAKKEPGPKLGLTLAERACRFLAWSVPLSVATLRASVVPSWQGDLANLRDVQLLPLGFGGGASTAVTQLARFLPLGTVGFRTAVVAALFLGLTGALLFSIALSLLRSIEKERSAWLAPTLAMIASLLTTVTPSYQMEATVAGGAMLGMATLFAVVSLSLKFASGNFSEPARFIVGLGALVGVCFAEDPSLGVLAVGYVGIVWKLTKRRGLPHVVLPRRAITAAFAFIAAALVFFALPPIVRAFSGRAAINLGFIASPRLAGLVTARDTAGVFSLLLRDVGLIPFAVAAFGAFISLLSRRARKDIAPLLIFALADGVGSWLMPRRLLSVVSLASWDLAALAALALALVAGVHAIVTRLLSMKIPMARPAAALVVALHLMLVALVGEQAADRADRTSHSGAQEWTDAALTSIRPRGAILVRDPDLMLRLYAAQLLEGARPDVTVIPLSYLGWGTMAADVLARDKAVEPLVRTFSLTGGADEYALSALAEERPVYTMGNDKWDKRVASHLYLAGPWLGFSAQPTGAVDKEQSLTASTAALRTVFRWASADAPTDPVSADVARRILVSDAGTLVRSTDLKVAGELIVLARAASGEALFKNPTIEVTVAIAQSKEIESEKEKARKLQQDQAAARARALEKPRASRKPAANGHGSAGKKKKPHGK